MIGWLLLIAMKCLSHYQVSSLQAIPNPLYLLSYWEYPTLKKKKMPFVQPLLTQKMKGSENESYIGWTNSLLQWVPHPRLVILHWRQIFSMMRIPRDEKTMISMHKFVGLVRLQAISAVVSQKYFLLDKQCHAFNQGFTWRGVNDIGYFSREEKVNLCILHAILFFFSYEN